MIASLFSQTCVVALAGGVGGSKMVNGLAQILPPENLFIIANTGDDFEHLGLYICPDLDTIMYTLAGINNLQTGWGRADETWQVMSNLRDLDGPAWFNMGDKDLATSLLRTHWLRQGRTLSEVTGELCRRFGARPTLRPMTDSPVRTIVHTDEGELGFQDYFVQRRCEPRLQKLVFAGADTVTVSDEIAAAIRTADLIVMAPSNPWLSLDPILALPGMTGLIQNSTAPKIGVSPIIGGTTVKGPAAKIMRELGVEVSPLGVAQHLQSTLTGLVIDTVDQEHQARIEDLGLKAWCADTLMRSPQDQARLARIVIEFGLKQ